MYVNIDSVESFTLSQYMFIKQEAKKFSPRIVALGRFIPLLHTFVMSDSTKYTQLLPSIQASNWGIRIGLSFEAAAGG